MLVAGQDCNRVMSLEELSERFNNLGFEITCEYQGKFPIYQGFYYQFKFKRGTKSLKVYAYKGGGASYRPTDALPIHIVLRRLDENTRISDENSFENSLNAIRFYLDVDGYVYEEVENVLMPSGNRRRAFQFFLKE